MPSQAPKISSFRNELTDGRRTDGAFDLPPVPSKSSTSYKPAFGIDATVSALERVEHIFLNVTSALDKVPTIAERLSRIDGILPERHQFNADESMDYIEMERLLISEMCDGAAQLVQSSARLLNTVKRFKTMQDSRCNTYEKGDDLVLKQMEGNEAAARRTEVDTEANNLSGDNRNDVDLEAPVLEETTGGVDAGVDERGVNNVSADKSKILLMLAHSPTVDVPVNKDLVDSGEAHSPTVDVPVNKDPVDGDVASVDVKTTDVEEDVNVAGVGGKVDDEDVAAASVLGCKSSGIGSDANDNVSDSEELPPENFPPRGLDYDGANAAKVDAFFFTVTRLRTNRKKRELPMFRNEEGDAKIEHVAEAFKLEGMINSNAADVVLYSLREKFQGTDRLIVPRWVTTKILIGDTAGNVRQWFLKSVSDGIDFLHFPTFDPPLEDLDMKSGEAVGHWCLVVLNLKFRCFECLDSLRDETWESAVSFFRTMTDNTKRLWRECNIDRLRLLTPARIDDFSAEFVRVSLQQNTHDCGFFMLQNCKSYHCRDDGVIELLDYTHVDIPAIRKTLLYTCATSELFNVDFRGLFGIEPCEWLDLGENDYRIFGSQFLELERVPVDLGLGRSPQKTRSGVQKGRLGDLKGSAAADAKTPVTPKDHIVQLIDSEESDDAFEKIPVVRRVTRSAAVKGVSPLAGVVHRRAGVARKDAALESGNVTSTKHAPRAPLKFSSPVQELHPYKFPHLDKARRLYDIMFRDEARKMYAGNCFALIPQPDGSVTDFTGKRIWEVFAPGQLMEGDVMMPLFKPIVLAKDKTVPHYSLYVMNRYRNTIDILDSLPYQKKRGASSKSMYHKHCELIFTRLVQVLKAVYGQAQYNASKQPNRAAIAKRPRYVALPLQGENECGNYAMKYAATYDGEKLVEDIQDQDPRVVDWKSQDLYTIVFNPKNQVMVTELPAEIQPLAPNAD